MTNSQLGVLIIGAGDVSTQHIQAFQRNPHTTVRAICSRTLESCEKRAAEAGLLDVELYVDYEKALRHPDIQIVSICTPHHLHHEHAMAAAQAGKHLVLEKPVANTMAEILDIEQAVKQTGVKTVVSFVLRWNPLFQTIKQMIADDTVGDVYYLETDYQHYLGSAWSGWENGRKQAASVSAMLVAGCHAVDALRWFAAPGEFEAARPVEVFAMAGGYRKDQRSEWDFSTASLRESSQPMEYDGLEVVLVRFDNGTLGKVSVNFDCIQPYRFPVEIFGNRGTIHDNQIWSHKFKGQTDWVNIPTICPDSGSVTHHPFQGEMDHFVECIRSGQESHCNISDARRTHEILFAAQECYQTHAPVRLG
ncbi:Gfo/Idh/MocA family oxidoreductase [bacterium]|nr:Gfo/Idh/MocA family oxidoreductase [bacterium]